MVPRWRFLATFLHPVFSASRMQQVSDLHLKFTLRRHTMCGSMRRLRLGEEKKKKEEQQQITA